MQGTGFPGGFDHTLRPRRPFPIPDLSRGTGELKRKRVRPVFEGHFARSDFFAVDEPQGQTGPGGFGERDAV